MQRGAKRRLLTATISLTYYEFSQLLLAVGHLWLSPKKYDE